MKKLTFISTLLLIIAFVGSGFSQKPVCPVKVKFLNLDNEGREVLNATATAINKTTKKIYSSVVGNGYVYFPALSPGDYQFIAVKKGFKRSVQNHSIDCEPDEFTYALPLAMVKGSSKQTAVLGERRLGIKTIVGDYDGPVRPAEPTKSPPDTPSIISGGVVNGKAVNLVKPEYPPAALAIRASGAVSVQVLINEQGHVISASAVSGHPLLRAASEKAAKESKFPPTLLSGQPVKVSGVIIYNFQP